MDVNTLKGPCYWEPEGNDMQPPVRLSAGTVLYGRSPFSDDMPVTPRGIGYRGLWKTL